MKKTLLLTHEYYPFRGGIASYCYNLFRRLPSDSYVVVTDQPEASVHVASVHSKLLSSILRPRWLYAFFPLYQMIRKHRVELIVTPHILPLGIIAYYFFRFLGIPYVISLHGLDINNAIDSRKLLTLKILSNAQFIIVNSAATKKALSYLSLPTPIEVITPALATDSVTVSSEAKKRIANRFKEKKIILTVGRLVRRKGQDYVLRALPRILQEAPEAHYCIVGSGPDYQYFTDLISELGVESHVTIITDASDDEKNAFYAAATVFAMPTRRRHNDIEGFGIVYLEAAYFSVPIIAGNSGGEYEAVGNESCAIRVNGRNLNEITEALIGLLTDSELGSFLAKNAHQRLARLPGWDTQAMVLKKILS